ncbi:MAG: hypothetical protein P4L67_03115 [Candidatus Pacebacteria bacterium]|nr:hypothetical protein [Candidatus Paceibacterota bacterium]
MYFIYRKYGNTIEITEIEKEPPQGRVFAPRKRRDVFEARRPDNTRRTKKLCMWRVSSALEEYGCPLLVTLTFNGDASDAFYASDSLRNFQVRLRDKYPQAQSIFIPELSPRGRIHFHGLLFNVPLSLGDTREGERLISHGDERKTRILAKLWGEGFVDAVKTDGSPKLAHYISKYITKGADHVIFNGMRRLMRISHGFPQQIEIKGEFAEYLAHRYANKKPIKEWEGDNIFLGKVIRKTYLQKEP